MYRSLGPKRAEPLPGCSSFFQEGLAKWRELCSAEHWLAAAAALQPLCQSLPQLVHHRDEVLDTLLGCLRMEATLSLEPALELVGTLARDLQADYLPALPRVLEALADLVDAGGWWAWLGGHVGLAAGGWDAACCLVPELPALPAAAWQRATAAADSHVPPACPPAPPRHSPTRHTPAGLDREPELLQHLFACLSLVCKHLCKLLVGEARLLELLRRSARLRHHAAEHVRALAAEALGFLLRWAGLQGAGGCSGGRRSE